MKRLKVISLLICLWMLLIPGRRGLADLRVSYQVNEDGTNQIVTFTAEPETEADTEAASALQEKLDDHFRQSEAFRTFARVIGRGGERTIFERGFSFSTDRFLSMLVIWNGQQPGGGRGSQPLSLCVSPKTGEDIRLMDLFLNADLARARLEELIEVDILDSISDYLEYADLLPLPEDCFYLDADGLTIYYDDEHYRTFYGECGAVSFAWYEIADLINPEGPAGGLIGDRTNAEALKGDVQSGTFGEVFPVSLGEKLGDVLSRFPKMSDPDYTRNSKLYMFEAAQLRGFSVEIPKYAFTENLDTPISAIRAARIDFHGLRTGWTGRDDITQLLGEPVAVLEYDEQTAEDMMLSPGESLVYKIGEHYLEVHLDGESLLSMLILRMEMPDLSNGI